MTTPVRMIPLRLPAPWLTAVATLVLTAGAWLSATNPAPVTGSLALGAGDRAAAVSGNQDAVELRLAPVVFATPSGPPLAATCGCAGGGGDGAGAGIADDTGMSQASALAGRLSESAAEISGAAQGGAGGAPSASGAADQLMPSQQPQSTASASSGGAPGQAASPEDKAKSLAMRILAAVAPFVDRLVQELSSSGG